MIKKRLVSQDLDAINISSGNLQVEQIKNIIKNENPIFLEIGANCGQTTIELIKNFPNAIIHCFEPDPRAIKKFKKNIDSPNVYLHEIAIGNKNGVVSFNQSAGGEAIDPEGWDHSGSIHSPKAHLEMFPWVRFDKKIDVPICRLDDWAKNNSIADVDFIWADVQGAEEDMILGGFEVLKRTKFLYTEYYDNECYEGQIILSNMYKLLNNFLIIVKYENDVLLENFFANNKLPNNLILDFISKANLSENYDDYLDNYGVNKDCL
jgi:FkbM family methyltransferase